MRSISTIASSRNAQGIILILLSTISAAATSAGSKFLVADFPAVQILFFRCAFAFLFAAAWARYNGWPVVLSTSHLPSHLLRGILNIVSLVLYVGPMAYLPLADVIALSFTQPLFATALSIPLLRERVSMKMWLAVVVGFAGTLVMLRPGWSTEQIFIQLTVIFGSLLWALSLVLTRKLTLSESSTTIVLYYLLVGSACTGIVLPFEWLTPSPQNLALFCALGVVSAATQFLMTEAYRRAPASVVSPYFYATLLWTTAFGYLLWREIPDIYVLVGSFIVLCSGIYLAANLPAQTSNLEDPQGTGLAGTRTK